MGNCTSIKYKRKYIYDNDVVFKYNEDEWSIGEPIKKNTYKDYHGYRYNSLEDNKPLYICNHGKTDTIESRNSIYSIKSVYF
ncbi:hypothetical protein DpV84gp030 [Deerpox virus W-1170-84]|uniref:Uncharacterized protein n=1 Tax=Deerpox virus (strain W-1170-84) TaxID=305676 RepID=Q08FF1_DPV84|nr:hypothetical protein DpV84gp030 [Deerpox virus W-1170-84]